MGLSFDFLVYSNSGSVDLRRPSDEAEAQAVIRRLYPRTAYERIGTGRLLDVCRQPRGRAAIGVFGDGVLIATKDAHLYDPGILNRRFFAPEGWTDLQLLTSESSGSTFAYGRWRSGAMTRCLSVNPVGGVWRDSGTAQPFEAGTAVSEEQWLELSNAALHSTLNLPGDAGPASPDAVNWDDVVLHVFAPARG